MTSTPNPFPCNFPPDWASAWGYDAKSAYPFAELKLNAELRMRFRWIPPGRFFMGSPEGENGEAGRFDDEGPQHWVVLSSGLWLAETPCTQAEWMAVMGQNPSHFTDDANGPVEQVSWDECQGYCRKLNERLPELCARLPTEAEWEYACRAGTPNAFNDGSDCTSPEGKDPALLKLGWFRETSEQKTHAVRQLLPNAWGLHDCHGNVREWCQDFYGHCSADEQRDPTGPVDGTGRVIRGGSWGDRARLCRSAYRRRWPSSGRFNYLGFRLVAGQ